MADYTPIGDAELLPDQPITQALMTRLRENPIAIIERAPGAPTYGWTVTTTGSNANGYYRIWDDGFIEQWFTTDTGGADRLTITFPTAFTTLESIAVVMSDERGLDAGGSDVVSHVDTVITTSFDVSVHVNARAIHWRAIGY